MGEREVNILIAGVGGQGNILSSQVIAEAALRSGKKALIGEVYGVSMRGGSVLSHVRLGDAVFSPLPPRQGVHVVCGLEPMETLRQAVAFSRRDGTIITNTRPLQPSAVNRGKAVYPSLARILGALRCLCRTLVSFDATSLAIKAGGALATNMVLVGAVSAVEIVGVPLQSYEETIRTMMPKAVEMNLAAFRLGREEYNRLAHRRAT
jgi:indolepyruvate ferredoxin oxidoreductase, beta subunit